MIRELTWDSDFFDIRIGEWNVDEDVGTGAKPFELIYVKSQKGEQPFLEGFEDRFGETKVVFAKKLQPKEIESKNIRPANSKDDIQQLYDLAYESGRFSRFRLDGKFGEDNFKKLYRAWIDNSLNGHFADNVLVYTDNESLEGIVTYKINDGFATIGLIAVSSEKQGRGIGKELLSFVERELTGKGVFELRIPTQLENKGAYSFYKKQGYTILEILHIKHYWKNDTL